MKEYTCPLSKTGMCEFAGNKYYYYGFLSGTANYCRHKMGKRFVSDIKQCPKNTKSINNLDKRK